MATESKGNQDIEQLPEENVDDLLIEVDELLVEEVSIDGMCGVY